MRRLPDDIFDKIPFSLFGVMDYTIILLFALFLLNAFCYSNCES